MERVYPVSPRLRLHIHVPLIIMHLLPPSSLPSSLSFLPLHLLLWQIDGVSYRGRVMVQVDMDLGTLPTNKHEGIKLSDQLRVKVRTGLMVVSKNSSALNQPDFVYACSRCQARSQGGFQ